MDTTAAELVESDERRDPRGRRYTGPEQRQRMLEAFEESGLTQRSFAQRDGIKYSTFVSWVQGRRRGRPSGLIRAKGKAPQLQFFEASLPALACSLEVGLPDGTTVRSNDAHALAALVKALRD